MALTNAEKYRVRKYLGYPQVAKQANPRLESAFDVVGADADAVADIQDILLKITAVESQLSDALDTAGLKRAEEIEWYQDKSGSAVVKSLNGQGNKFCSQLSIIFGVPIQSKIFGPNGYTGDNWKQFGNGGTGASESSFDFNLGFK